MDKTNTASNDDNKGAGQTGSSQAGAEQKNAGKTDTRPTENKVGAGSDKTEGANKTSDKGSADKNGSGKPESSHSDSGRQDASKTASDNTTASKASSDKPDSDKAGAGKSDSEKATPTTAGAGQDDKRGQAAGSSGSSGSTGAGGQSTSAAEGQAKQQTAPGHHDPAEGEKSSDRQGQAGERDESNERSGTGRESASPASLVQRLKEFDEQRPSFPGEHWLVFAAGAWLMTKAGRQRSIIKQTLMLTAGSALLARAASGRDGLIKVASRVMGNRRF